MPTYRVDIVTVDGEYKSFNVEAKNEGEAEDVVAEAYYECTFDSIMTLEDYRASQKAHLDRANAQYEAWAKDAHSFI